MEPSLYQGDIPIHVWMWHKSAEKELHSQAMYILSCWFAFTDDLRYTMVNFAQICIAAYLLPLWIVQGIIASMV